MGKGNKMYRGGEKDEGLKPRKEQNGRRMEGEEEEEERAKKTRRQKEERAPSGGTLQYDTTQYHTVNTRLQEQR